MSDIDFDALDPTVKEYVEKLEDALLESRDELAKAYAKVEADEVQEDDILKSADPAVQQFVEELRKQAEEAQSIAKAEREARLQREFVEKAEAFDNLPTNTEDLGALLKAIHEVVDTETFGKVEELLRTSDELIGKSAWDEIGSGMSTPGADKIEELAKAHQQEHGGTFEQAYAEVLIANPSLYEEARS